MQKRLVRKLDLELLLSQIQPHPSPKTNLEQYTIPVEVAATMLYLAAYTYDDIIDKNVIDMGCGTGRLALGAAFLGSKHVVGVDVDKKAIKLAFENSVKLKLKSRVQWINADINAIRGKFDTVLQNPPFGVQRRKADAKFLEKALAIGTRVYSLHKSLRKGKDFLKQVRASPQGFVAATPSSFIEDFVEGLGGRIMAAYSMVMTVPHMFPFHTKERHSFLVDLYVIEKC